MQKAFNPTLAISIVIQKSQFSMPRWQSGALLLLFSFAFQQSLTSQKAMTEPYDPCLSVPALASHCLALDYHTCTYYGPQFPCSSGYCWAEGSTSPNQGIPTGGIVQGKAIEIGGTYTIT
jgi:hypothetical protein